MAFAEYDSVSISHISKADATDSGYLTPETSITFEGVKELYVDANGKISDSNVQLTLTNKAARNLRKALNEVLGDA